MTANEPLSYEPAGSIDVILSVVPTMIGSPEASPSSVDVVPPPPAQPARRRAEAPKAPMARPRRPRPLWCSDIVLPLLGREGPSDDAALPLSLFAAQRSAIR